MLKCPKCGHENRPGTFSCDNCFRLLESGSETIEVSEALRQELSEAYDSFYGHEKKIDLPPQALEMIIETTRKSITLLPNEKPYYIGRRSTVDSFFNVDLSPHNGENLGVSRRHAMLYHTDEGWIIEDLDSTNGTLVNERRLDKKERYIIQNSDLIRFGLLTVQVQIG